jgi:hypothetical protein
MPALNFTLFVKAVENGIWDHYFGLSERGRPLPIPHPGIVPKRQTIRALRKDGRDPVVGDTLKLFAGMRTKKCRLLGVVECTRRWRIEIWRDGQIRRWVAAHGGYWKTYSGDGARLLARRDGFANREELVRAIAKMHGLPFSGYVFRW